MIDPKIIVLLSILGFTTSKNPCIYEWSYKTEPETCKSPKDCKDPIAECTFNPIFGKSVCCSAKKNAIFPVCPNGRTAYSLGRFSKLTCNPLIDNENDACPTGYECLKSTTNFTRYPNQPNYVCCKI